MVENQKIAGWGGLNLVDSSLKRADSEAIRSILSEQQSLIVRGKGKSYGDVAVNDESVVFLSGEKSIKLDLEAKTVICTADVILRDLQDELAKHKLRLPVIPGISTITVGGAIACDVHGKNHAKKGSFGHHINWIDLLIDSEEIIRCSQKENPDYFKATIGGIGLSGVILACEIQLEDSVGNMLKVSNKKLSELDQLPSYFENSASEYKIAWLKSENEIVYTESDWMHDFQDRKVKVGRLKWNFFGLLTSRLALKMVDRLRYARTKTSLIEHESKHLQPLDKWENWNELYPNGVYQIQFQLPKEKIVQGIQLTLERLKSIKAITFLATVKQFGDQPSMGLMSFPRKGFTFTIDVKNCAGIKSELENLVNELSDFGARFYFAKDALMKPKNMVNEPNIQEFKHFLKDKTNGKLQSEFSKRVNLTE